MVEAAHAYRICDLILGSAVPLPELSSVSNIRPDWLFRLRRGARAAADDGSTRFISPAGGSGEYIVRFAGLADFAISTPRRTIECFSTHRTSPSAVRHLLLDHVLPLVLSTESKLVLHASAVVGRRGVLVFMGTTGSGKSTLAFRLAQQGCAVLADDFVLLHEEQGQWAALPSYAAIRLTAEAIRKLVGEDAPTPRHGGRFAAKQHLGPHLGWRFHERLAPLHRVYVMAPLRGRPPHRSRPRPRHGPRHRPRHLHGRVLITPLTARAAMIELVKSTFRMGLVDRPTLRASFELSGRVAESIGVRQLEYPWSLSRLDDIRTALRKDDAL